MRWSRRLTPTLWPRVAKAEPEVIVHQLTGLSGGLRQAKRMVADTNRLRIEGTDHLLAAGRAVGVRRFVAQSNAAWMERAGGPVADENGRLEPDPPEDAAALVAAFATGAGGEGSAGPRASDPLRRILRAGTTSTPARTRHGRADPQTAVPYNRQRRRNSRGASRRRGARCRHRTARPGIITSPTTKPRRRRWLPAWPGPWRNRRRGQDAGQPAPASRRRHESGHAGLDRRSSGFGWRRLSGWRPIRRGLTNVHSEITARCDAAWHRLPDLGSVSERGLGGAFLRLHQTLERDEPITSPRAYSLRW